MGERERSAESGTKAPLEEALSFRSVCPVVASDLSRGALLPGRGANDPFSGCLSFKSDIPERGRGPSPRRDESGMTGDISLVESCKPEGGRTPLSAPSCVGNLDWPGRLRSIASDGERGPLPEVGDHPSFLETLPVESKGPVGERRVLSRCDEKGAVDDKVSSVSKPLDEE